jgi:hypothetical protein
MKPDIYKILLRCIDEGIERGFRRAHKHTDTPSHDEIKGAVEDAIIFEICEWFTFDVDADKTQP